jgi:hypothetical protein
MAATVLMPFGHQSNQGPWKALPQLSSPPVPFGVHLVIVPEDLCVAVPIGVRGYPCQRRRPNSRSPVDPPLEWSGYAHTRHHLSPRGENHRPSHDGSSGHWIEYMGGAMTVARGRSLSLTTDDVTFWAEKVVGSEKRGVG